MTETTKGSAGMLPVGTVFTTENIAVLAPTPSAIVSTAAMVNAGLRNKARPAYRRS